jgi:large subunit ribosomal protein L1
MGKKRIKTIDETKTEEKKKKPVEKERKVVKTGKEHGRITDMGAEALAEAERLKAKEKKLAKTLTTKAKAKAKKKGTAKAKVRGKKYQEMRKKIDRNQFYPLPKAIKLAQETSFSKFNGTLEAHLVVKESGLKGEIQFPHPTGKQTKIAIANEALLKQLEKGKIDFDVLLATPAIMPKLAPFAKKLGPRGLMPNPKAGTISEKPEALAKKMATKTQFKTETNAPLIHLVIGKVNAKPKELEANCQALVQAIGLPKISKIVLKSTMGPGIKVDLTSF